LTIAEVELAPHPEPWLLAPEVELPGAAGDDVKKTDTLTRQRALRNLNGTWAYQVIELHRTPADTNQGALLLIPGLGWNHSSVWTEAEEFVERKLATLVGR
jgi:hypothetical protein